MESAEDYKQMDAKGKHSAMTMANYFISYVHEQNHQRQCI
jgi:hypothetical protein